MSAKQYKIETDEKIGKYIKDFTLEEVITQDYFYTKPELLDGENNQYSDEELGLILNLTDTEYASLVLKYKSSESATTDLDESIKQSQLRITELEKIIDNHKKFEEFKNTSEQKKKELENITKQLALYEDINNKLIDAKNEFTKYEALSKYNLQKIHEDLSIINHDINEIEEQSMNQKVTEIKQKKTYAGYDNGKIVLALGVGFACAILGGIFLFFDMPTFITFTIWGIGFIISCLLIISSKNSSEEIVTHYNEEFYSDEELSHNLEKLKAKRTAILNILNLRHPDEFYLAKARYSSAKKALDSMLEQYQSLTKEAKINELLQKKTELLQFMNESLMNNSTSEISSEKLLEIYREIDALKLKVGATNKNNQIDKESIPGKINEIKNELKVKLPSYINLLKNTYENAIEEVKAIYDELCAKMGFKPEKDIANYTKLDIDEKIIVQYALALKFYEQNFHFIIQDSSKLDTQQQQNINKFIDSESKDNQIVRIDE